MDDDYTTPHLKCDIEIELNGPTTDVVGKQTADVLRALADRIERGEFEDGHHQVRDRVGKPVGTIYLDYFGVA